MSVARLIAEDWVNREDAEEREKRISSYEREIDEALSQIEKAKASGEKSFAFAYARCNGDVAGRVQSALSFLGYKILRSSLTKDLKDMNEIINSTYGNMYCFDVAW